MPNRNNGTSNNEQGHDTEHDTTSTYSELSLLDVSSVGVASSSVQ